MMIRKRVLLGVAALTVAGLFANNIDSKLENEVSFAAQETVVNTKPIEKSDGLQTPGALSRNFDADFLLLHDQVKGETDTEKIAKFRTFLNTHTSEVNQDEILWVHDKYATLLEKNDLSGVPSAAAVRAEIVRKFMNMSEEEKSNLELSKGGIAKSIFMDSENDFLKMTSIVLSHSDEQTLKRNLKGKRILFDTISEKLDMVILLGVPRWIVAAHYRNAMTSVDSSDAIRRSFVPPRLSAKQVVEYAKFLEINAAKIEVNALESLQKGLAFQHLQSQYLGESRILLERLKAKICPTEEEMEALHSTIWQIEHGSKSLAKVSAVGIGERYAVHFPEILEFKKKVMGDSPPDEVRSDAVALRMQTEGTWVCLPTATHDKFHKRLDAAKVEDEVKTEAAKSDKELVEEALHLMMSAKFLEVIEKCATVKSGCERMLAISYKNTGDAENACKYMRLGGLSSMKGVKCGAVKSIDPRSAKVQRVSVDLWGGSRTPSSKNKNAWGQRGQTRSEVKSTIRKYDGRITQCAQNSNEKNLEGAVKVEFSIKLDGHVTGARVLGAFAVTDVGGCVKKVVSGMKFPKRQSTKNQKISHTFTIGLTRTNVTSTIRKNSWRVNACAKNFNEKNLKGSVKVEFYIKPSGRVSGAKIRGSFKGTDVGRCVQKVVAGMKFPKTRATKNTKLIYPFAIR